MATQGERQGFMFPPNDNSVQTNLRYDLLAEKWVKSKKAAEYKYRSRSIKEDLSVIGLFVQLVFSLLTLVVLGLIQFVRWVRS